MSVIDDRLVGELDRLQDSQELIAEIFRRFGRRAAIGTSGQLTGSVIIDLAVQAGLRPRIFTIDTGRLFPESYAFFDEVERRYGLPVERISPDPQKIAQMVARHGEYLFFDSKEKQELCCRLRKVEPNQRVLSTLDVWITGLRKGQSAAREATARFEIIQVGAEQRSILKVAPLVDWTEQQLWDYVKKHRVPTHELLAWQQDGWRYESLGCRICTTPIGPEEPRRAGRWRWFNYREDDDKECGIHVVREDEV